MATNGHRQDSSTGGGISRGKVFLALLVTSCALSWMSPAALAPIRAGVRTALEPGRRATRWAAIRAARFYRKANRELPPADALGRRSTTTTR